jgi:uncharacterized membrane protein
LIKNSILRALKTSRNKVMKKTLYILLFVIMSAFFNNGYAQGPPPPPGGGFGGQNTGGGHGQGGNAGPEAAPVGGGLEILLVLGMTYAGRKVYKLKKEEKEESISE